MSYFIVVKPRSKVWFVARRMIGGQLSIIATCTDEHSAELIVGALNGNNK